MMQVEDKLQDLYGISKVQAEVYWGGSLYVQVLESKIALATRVLTKVLAEDKMVRDSARINRVMRAIDFNNELLGEVGRDH